jgi:hypothetical protein
MTVVFSMAFSGFCNPEHRGAIRRMRSVPTLSLLSATFRSLQSSDIGGTDAPNGSSTAVGHAAGRSSGTSVFVVHRSLDKTRRFSCVYQKPYLS